MSPKRNTLWVCVILLFILFVPACRSDEVRFTNDAVAVSEIRKFSAKLSSGQKLTAEEFTDLKTIFDKYPDSASVRKQYENALTQRQDWTALIGFYESIDPSARTDVQKANLAKLNLKLGRYQAALTAALELGPEKDSEMLTVAAGSYFYLGEYAKSKELLDASWDKIVKEKQVDAMAIRGLIYFYGGDTAKAREVLDQVIEIDPENIPALNGLSRVYAAEGNIAKAEEVQAKLQETFDRLTAEEKYKTNTVERFHRLEEAFRAKQYGEVIRIGRELLPAANKQNKAAIYQYLYNAHRALGNQKEAADVVTESRKLQ